MASDDLGLAQSPAQAAEGDGLAERLRLEAEADVMETARDGTFERRDAERWAAIMYEAADEIDRLRALSAEGSATIAAARKQAVEEMREQGAEDERDAIYNRFAILDEAYQSNCGGYSSPHAHTLAYLRHRGAMRPADRALLRTMPSSPEDQEKAAATPTIADPDGEARS